MYLHICHACQNGLHSSCEGTKSPPPGVFGGSMCTYRGKLGGADDEES